MKPIFILLLGCLFPIILFGQGKIDGFYFGKNNGAVVLGGGFEDSKSYLAGNNKLDLERSVYYASLFAAYGITDDLDVNLQLPYISSNKESDIQDISVFLKYRIFSIASEVGTVEVSGAAGFSTPISDYTIGGLNDIGQQATILETRAMVHFLGSTYWFATLQSGFSYKLEEAPNSIPATLKLGRATTNWYYDVFYDFQHAFGGIDYRGTPAPQNFRELGVDYHKIGGTLFKPFSEKLGGYVSVAYVFEGRNTFLGASYGFGGSYRF